MIRNWFFTFLVLVGIPFILFGTWQFPSSAQEKKSYELTETQTLRLKVKQLEYASAFEHYQQAVNAFNVEVKAVEKEHDWPETVQFDPSTLTFKEPPPSPPAKTPEKPQPKKDEGAK